MTPPAVKVAGTLANSLQFWEEAKELTESKNLSGFNFSTGRAIGNKNKGVRHPFVVEMHRLMHKYTERGQRVLEGTAKNQREFESPLGALLKLTTLAEKQKQNGIPILLYAKKPETPTDGPPSAKKRRTNGPRQGTNAWWDSCSEDQKAMSLLNWMGLVSCLSLSSLTVSAMRLSSKLSNA